MLEIEKIELEKYRGFQLNNVKKFVMEIKSNITVLLGRNGCGKSMLMVALPPLCPNKKLFKVGGGRKLTFRCTKGRFLATNVRTQGGMKNTLENLDTGELVIKDANPSVFDETINDLTGYNKDIHQLLMGNVRLSTMSTPERKKWFSLLSESDLTFALKFYTQARKRMRTLSGGIDLLKEELGELKVKVLETEEEYAVVRVRRDELTKEIGVIDAELAHVDRNAAISEATVMKQIEAIEGINRQIIKLDPFIPADLVDVNQTSLEVTAGEITAAKSIYLGELERIHKRLYELKKMDTINIRDVDERLEAAREEAAMLMESLHVLAVNDEVPLEEYLNAQSWYSAYGTRWLDALAAFTLSGFLYADEMSLDNVSGSLASAINGLEGLTLRRNKVANMLTVFNERLNHIDDCKVVQCDNCNHEFKPGVKAGEYDELIVQREDLVKQLIELDANIEKSTAIVNKYSELNRIQYSLIDADAGIECNSVLCELRDIMPAEVFDGMGGVAAAWAEEWKEDVVSVIKLRAVNARIDKIEVDRAIIMAAQGQDTAQLEARQDELDQTIHKLSERFASISYDIDRINTIKKTMASFDTLGKQLDDQWSSYQRALFQLTENIRFELLLSNRHEINELLNETLKRMNEMDGYRKRIVDVEDQLKRTEVKYIQAGKIVKAMSPEEGVLAKHLFRCITSVTELMTAYIGAMWNYDMKVLPCNIANGELDYQFGLWAGVAENAVDDVSEGSFAQKGVVDFVFMLTAYKALKLNRFPLWLDELGNNFDEGHGDEMVTFIKGLLNKGQHSQVIMISHNANQHFQLTQADMVVLDKHNITLPSNYNRFVEMS